MKILLAMLSLVMALGLMYGIWLVKRKVNYNYNYEEQVTRTVKKLDEPYKKKLRELEARVSKLEQQNGK